MKVRVGEVIRQLGIEHELLVIESHSDSCIFTMEIIDELNGIYAMPGTDWANRWTERVGRRHFGQIVGALAQTCYSLNYEQPTKEAYQTAEAYLLSDAAND